MKFILCFFSGALLGNFAYATTMDSTEVSIGEFSKFVASPGLTTHAEQYGGMVYEGGWVVKPNWNWRAPYGEIGAFDEPAVHVTYAEAEKYCEWKGKRLPTKREWVEAGYTEKRLKPTDGYVTGKTYPYPTGESPAGANCLSDCDAETLLVDKKKNYHVKLNRGLGHAPVGVSKQGVNGLYDMGANVWEWAKLPSDNGHQATMGGSWWYGKRQMRANYGATKPKGMAVVYIGFRCISDNLSQRTSSVQAPALRN